MSKNKLIATAGAVGLIAAVSALSACSITRNPDGTIIVEPAEGKPRQLPPSRVTQITINGKCYYQFEGVGGTQYCFACDLEGKGYAEPCSGLIERGISNVSNALSPVELPSAEERAFMAMLTEWMQQEGIPRTHDAIWHHFELDEWVEGETALVTTALAELDDEGEGFLKFMMISRTDWDYPDTSGGSEMEYYFLRDASDNVPDAMVLQLSGTFQQVADSMKTFFNGVFTYEAEYEGNSVLIVGDQNLVSFIVGGVTLWEG